MQATSMLIDKNWKDLIKPNKLEIVTNENKSVAKVIAEPLEKGFGQTIGNSLRRILFIIDSRGGSYRYTNRWCFHEFSSIKGVREDVTDIVLNVKNLAIKSSTSLQKRLF